jgi:hypothetical protein
MSVTDDARQDELEWKRQAVSLFKIAGVVGIAALFLVNHFEIPDNAFWIVPAFAIAVRFADRWVERIPEAPRDAASAIQADQTYDLCFTVGAPRIRLRLSARGVRLVEDAIAYTWEGAPQENKLLDITAIRLQLAGSPVSTTACARSRSKAPRSGFMAATAKATPSMSNPSSSVISCWTFTAGSSSGASARSHSLPARPSRPGKQ